MNDWANTIVMFGGTSWEGPPMPDRCLAGPLRAYAPLLYVDPPVSHPAAKRDPRLVSTLGIGEMRVIEPGFARLLPLAPPGRTRPVLRELGYASARRAARRAVRDLGADVHAVIVGSFDDLFRTRIPGIRVLYGTDDFVAGAKMMRQSTRILERDEKRALASADIVLAVSEPLAERWRAMGATVTVVPNGCDAARFADVDNAPLPDDVTLEPPIAGVFGRFSDRTDISYLEAVAATGCSLLMVGPRDFGFGGERFDAIVRRPNVQWLGERPFAVMPSYLRVIEVGLTPYADIPFNRASFPLKTIEYLAAGRAAISTNLPASRELGSEHITIVDSPSEMADAVVAALAQPRSDALVAQRRAFAQQHSWERRAAKVAQLLGLRSEAAA